MACGMLNFGSNALILSVLGKYAENRVFAPNISVVENNSVVLGIDCCVFSNLVFTKEGHTPYRGVPFPEMNGYGSDSFLPDDFHALAALSHDVGAVGRQPSEEVSDKISIYQRRRRTARWLFGAFGL